MGNNGLWSLAVIELNCGIQLVLSAQVFWQSINYLNRLSIVGHLIELHAPSCSGGNWPRRSRLGLVALFVIVVGMAQVETEFVFDDQAVKTGGEEAPIFGVSLVKIFSI